MFQLLVDGEMKPVQIARKTSLPLWKVYSKRSKIGNASSGLKKQIKSLDRQITALVSLDIQLKSRGHRFDDGRQLFGGLQAQLAIPPMSESYFFRQLKATGLRNKKAIYRTAEKPNLKEMRIEFFSQYIYFLQSRHHEVTYFIWTSFAESNFKSRSWSLQGQKSIVQAKYHYCAFHLMALISRQRVECYQFIRGRLAGDVVFNFLSGAISNLRNLAQYRGKKLVVVLDNAPMNYSNAITGFCVSNQIKLLFIAPNSSFLNPIEMLFALIKSNLKKMFKLGK